MERLHHLASPRPRVAASFLAVIIFFLIAHYGFQVGVLPSVLEFSTIRPIEQSVRRPHWPLTADYDIVVAYFNEGQESLTNAIKDVVDRLPLFARHRVIIYAKSGERSEQALEDLLILGDEIVWLANVGREGETYLTHITRHYETAATNIAKHTIFMQAHIAWGDLMLPRLETLNSRVGFMSLAPYVNQTCGIDYKGNEFPRMADIYSAFRGELCPPFPVLATWAGQFVVSRKRILDNELQTYQKLLDLFHAPPEHWIWKEGWWNNEPSNPTLGTRFIQASRRT
ncbi:MAG: hypothetical protein TREMPRED_003508 [Tremellales sp. Tagirdzhanova-0007]|nr:MAG: hypothetical protein TREMPRED_003508 [Tremellales sp. Tagirdzhanova-0007]